MCLIIPSRFCYTLVQHLIYVSSAWKLFNSLNFQNSLVRNVFLSILTNMEPGIDYKAFPFIKFFSRWLTLHEFGVVTQAVYS
jgi:hypothetical protein